MQTKICSKCKRELPLSEFHADKRKKHGVGSECRDCKKKYRQKNKGKLMLTQKERRIKKKAELSPQVKAWNAVYYALKTGKIIKSDKCEICGRVENIQGHHADYDKPFDIVWVCQWCHSELDKQRRLA
jgi:hypothetical protein